MYIIQYIHNNNYIWFFLNKLFPSWVDSTTSKSWTPHNRNPIPDIRSPLLSCWSGLSKEFSKHTACCYYPWLPPEVEGKSLFLKRTCTSETEASELKWTWMPPLWGLPWYQKVTWKLTKEGGTQQSYPATTPTNHFNNQHGTLTEECSSGTHTLLATTSSLIGLMTLSARWKPRQLYGDHGVMHLGGETTDITLLNRRNSHVFSCLFYYTYHPTWNTHWNRWSHNRWV